MVFCLVVAWQFSFGVGVRKNADMNSALVSSASNENLDPVEISGHTPAMEVYKIPDETVRVEGINQGGAGNGITAGTNSKEDVNAMLIYAVESRPIGVELKLPDFFLPHDERKLEVWHQGELVHTCEVPSMEICKYTFDYGISAGVGRRYTVRALRKYDNAVLDEQRIYTPYPYMCAASLFTRPDISNRDCSKLESFPDPVIVNFSRSSNRAFAIELEFLAKDGELKEAKGGPEALEEVKKCAIQKVVGTEFEQLANVWNWEEEPSMVPYGPRDNVPESEYYGLMAELTSPGPPVALFGQQGMVDVARVFHTVSQMSVQVGIWAQLHVHVNVRSEKANPASDCCLDTNQVINIWTAWSKYQMVIDEMQNPTNVDNKWAKPLYMEDVLAQHVFSNMHAYHGKKDLNVKDACEAFYGKGQCDSKDHSSWKPPHASEVETGHYFHGPARYYAVNLAPLPDKGTIEIRQQAGTSDIERAQRWIQFVLAFVETFKSGQGLFNFFDETVEKDVRDLKFAQTMASFDTLFDAMGDRIDEGSKDYFKQRSWRNHDPNCAFN